MLDTNSPTMAEECYILSRKKSRYTKLLLQKKLKKLENRFDMLDDDLYELKREIDDIKKILSESKSKNKYRGEAPLLCRPEGATLKGHNTSSDSSESD